MQPRFGFKATRRNRVRKLKPMWAINYDVLKALAQSKVWKDSGLEERHGFTPQIIYGPN